MIDIKMNFPIHIGEPSIENAVEITATLTGDETEDSPSVFFEVLGNGVMPDGTYQFTDRTAVVMACHCGHIMGITDPLAVATIAKEVTHMQVAFNALRNMTNMY